ncbi:putative calpain-like protease ory [Erysiphe necator]|uniref:Putative calpain-like protease ory n=1 Tax=Uncinula necator TaxID=52586 RepID=A0A0B1NX46_UNCNE|nr:putative calpain-like protease ory [Erysiphe necator]
MEAENLVSKSLTRDDALKNAIRATELYMSAIEHTVLKSEKNRLQNKCRLLLQKAEEIKGSMTWPLAIQESSGATQESSGATQESSGATQESSGVILKAPVPTRKLSKNEHLILLEGSRLNGFTFPPWTSEPDDDVFENSIEGEKYYTEPVNLRLSDAQRSIFSGWIRLDRDDPNRPGESSVLISTDRATDLVQDIIADCSVVASLCVISSRASKGHGQLTASVLYPKHKTLSLPKISKNGKYICRLQFNGCFRKVTIDNRLPKSNLNRSLHVTDRNDPQNIWPALIEKAYLKVRGGYDFPGSNSGTDLWIISGWIPEQIFLQSDDIQIEQLWYRIFKAFCYGDVMITLGTGKLTEKEENELGLVGHHDYAILDMKEVSSKRLLLIKNPWCDEKLQGLSFELSETAVGTFWMNIESTVQNFEYLYLNWNPGLFRHRQDYHFNWKLPENKNSGSFIHNPQYTIRSSQKDSVWILLSRHFSTDEQNIVDNLQNKISGAVGHISLYVFESSGQKIYTSDYAIHRGAFVDSPQTLARINLSPSIVYTTAIAQHGLPLPQYSFTLSFFSRFPLVIDKVAEPAYYSSQTGAWSLRTAGGNASLPYYHKNPQFSISVTSEADIDLILEAAEHDFAIHIDMVWAGGERVVGINSKDIVGDSGDYRRGCALTSLKNVAAGKYTIVCSTFDVEQTGRFTLHTCSTAPCDVQPIPLEIAGRLTFNLEPLNFPSGVTKMFAKLTISRLTRIRLLAKSLKTSKNSSLSKLRLELKLSIETGQVSKERKVLCVSGDGNFSDVLRGIRLEDLDLTQTMSNAGLWIVVERFSVDHCSDVYINVEVLSDSKVTLGNWRIYDG